MKLSHVLIAFVILCSRLQAQTEVLSIDVDYGVRLVNIKGVPHVISLDSIYKIYDDASEAYLFKDKADLYYVSDSIFVHRGGGSVYKLNSDFALDTLLYAPKMETSFFNSANFIHNDTLFSFGGYGNFSFKNELIFFNNNLRSWSYYPDYTKEDNKPKPASILSPWNYSNDILTIYRTYIKVDGGPESRKQIFSMDRFDFNQNKWISKSPVSKLKSLIDNSNIPRYGNGFSIHRFERSFFLFDYENAIVEEYSSDSGLLNNLVGFQILGDHIYTLNRFNETHKVYKTPLNIFFSQKLSSESVVDQKSYYLPIAILTIIFLLIFLFIYFRKKPASAVSIITNRLHELEFDISKVHYDLLKELVAKHPQPITFKFVLSLYDDSIGYEAKKLKTRKTVKELNDQLEKKFDLKNPLEVRRNPSDKRQYEVYINEN